MIIMVAVVAVEKELLQGLQEMVVTEAVVKEVATQEEQMEP